MTGRVVATLVLAGASGVLACGAWVEGTSREQSRAVAEAAIGEAREVVLGRLRPDDCTGAPRVCVRGLVVTAHMCLACRDVGLLVRTLAARPGAPLVVVTPDADREAVLQFFRDERTTAIVLPAPSPALTEDRAPELLGYFELGPDSVEVRRAVGYRAAAVLESLDGTS